MVFRADVLVQGQPKRHTNNNNNADPQIVRQRRRVVWSDQTEHKDTIEQKSSEVGRYESEGFVHLSCGASCANKNGAHLYTSPLDRYLDTITYSPFPMRCSPTLGRPPSCLPHCYSTTSTGRVEEGQYFGYDDEVPDDEERPDEAVKRLRKRA